MAISVLGRVLTTLSALPSTEDGRKRWIIGAPCLSTLPLLAAATESEMGAAYAMHGIEDREPIGSFSSDEEALATVRRAVEEDGEDSIDDCALGRTDRTGATLTDRRLVRKPQSA